MKERKLLDEAGLLITSNYIATSSHRFPLRGLKTIELRTPPKGILAFLKIEKVPYQVIVDDFRKQVIILETFDQALVKRVAAAITAARHSYVPDHKLVRSR